MGKESFDQPEEHISRKEELDLELDKMHQAFDEALERLCDCGAQEEATELIGFTTEEKDVGKVEEFLNENSDRLSEEGKLLLNTTIHLRKIKSELEKLREE